MPRTTTPKSVETDVLIASRRRCALCFGLSGDQGIKPGQIAHIDKDASNSVFSNLAWLCLPHHDEYDTRRSQSKGLTPDELRRHRDDLCAFVSGQRELLEPNRPFVTLTPEGAGLAELLSRRSRNGYRFDPQVRIDSLATELGVSPEDAELAIDELGAAGLLEINGPRDIIFPTDRLFWETDPIFSPSDPSADAESVACALVGHTADTIIMSDFAALLAWPPRRLNPAASYLVETGRAGGLKAAGQAPYCYREITRTASTKRFVRDLDRRG